MDRTYKRMGEDDTVKRIMESKLERRRRRIESLKNT